MRRPLIGSLAFVAAVSAAAVTQAHIELMMPPPRHLGDGVQKVGPCGVADSVRGSTFTAYEPGATVNIEWRETIQHGGHYRILFAENGNAFPNPANITDFCTPGQELTPGSGIWCLADNIADNATNGSTYSQSITFPDMTCNNCTLQLIQYMIGDDGMGNPVDQGLYFKCADLVLGSPGTGGAGGSSSTTTTTTTTTTSAGSGGAGGAPASDFDPYPSDDSGCAIGRGHGTTAAAALGALGLLALLGRRRRRDPR